MVSNVYYNSKGAYKKHGIEFQYDRYVVYTDVQDDTVICLISIKTGWFLATKLNF